MDPKIATALLLLAWGTAPAEDEVLWIEGEKPAKSTFFRHNRYDDVDKSVLSGGDWIPCDLAADPREEMIISPNPDLRFPGIDPLTQDLSGGGHDAKSARGTLATPQEVLAIGRVLTAFDEGGKPPEKADWAKRWDKEKKVVRSMTGQIEWDYGRRVVTPAGPSPSTAAGAATTAK